MGEVSCLAEINVTEQILQKFHISRNPGGTEYVKNIWVPGFLFSPHAQKPEANQNHSVEGQIKENVGIRKTIFICALVSNLISQLLYFFSICPTIL